MGYMYESDMSPDKAFVTEGIDNGVAYPVMPGYSIATRSRSQYGYRSGPLGPEEQRAVQRIDNAQTNRYSQGYLIGALESIYESNQSMLGGYDPAMVHYREYTETHGYPGPIVVNGRFRRSQTAQFRNFSSHGAIGITSVAPTSYPTAPSESDTRNWASARIRSIRPTVPTFRLARFVGELRDAHKMFDANAYFLKDNPYWVGPSPSQLGGASLNVQFAVQPTASDLQKAGEAVLQGDKILRQYLRDSFRQVQRKSRDLVDSKVYTGTGSWQSVYPFNRENYTVAGVRIKGVLGNLFSEQPRPQFNVYLNTTVERRVFATYKYAVENPYNILGRMDSYRDKAEHMLGITFDAQTLWDLTPFSWLIDWFTDIGGLLGYQQDVADDRLVTSRAGFIIEKNAYASVDLVGSALGTYSSVASSSGSATLTEKVQFRYPGTPYSMGPDWSGFSNSQWGILASLGLAFSNKVPVLRYF